MNFEPRPYYTIRTLADECGMNIRTIERHIKAGTARLDKATEKVPGIGIRINGPAARKFIELIRAKDRRAS